MRTLGFSIVFFMISAACVDSTQTSDPKIVGGRPAGNYGFMAGLLNKNSSSPFCGGSFIREDVVLTAAHCVTDEKGGLFVSVGTPKRDEHGKATKIAVSSILVHDDYNDKANDSDLALLFLDKEQAAAAADVVKPIALQRDTDVGATLRAIGWGNGTSKGHVLFDELQEVDLPVVDVEDCRKGGGGYEDVSERQICAGNLKEGGIDTCQGDSGGPLFKPEAGNESLVGIVSWGQGCAEPEKAGVYTRVSAFVSWIETEMTAYDHGNVDVTPTVAGRLVKNNCAGKFDKSETENDGKNSRTIRSKYNLSEPFNEASTPAPSDTPIDTCEFTGSADRKFVLSLYRRSGATAEVVYRLESNGQAWESAGTGEVTFNMDCEKDEVESSLYFFGLTGFFSHGTDNYTFSTPFAGNADEAVEVEACTVKDVGYAILRKTEGDVQTNYLKIISEHLPGSPLLYELRIDGQGSGSSGNDDGNSGRDPSLKNIKVDFTAADAKSGKANLRNNLEKTIFGWKLECDFEFVLKAGGETFASMKSGSKYRVQFSSAHKKLGFLPSNSDLVFDYEIMETLEDASKYSCDINGLSTEFVYNP